MVYSPKSLDGIGTEEKNQRCVLSPTSVNEPRFKDHSDTFSVPNRYQIWTMDARKSDLGNSEFLHSVPYADLQTPMAPLIRDTNLNWNGTTILGKTEYNFSVKENGESFHENPDLLKELTDSGYLRQLHSRSSRS